MYANDVLLPRKGPEGNSLGIGSPSAAGWAVIIAEPHAAGPRRERAGRGSCPGSERGLQRAEPRLLPQPGAVCSRPVPGVNTDQLLASELRLAGGEGRTRTEALPSPARAASVSRAAEMPGLGARPGWPRGASPALPASGPERPGRRWRLSKGSRVAIAFQGSQNHRADSAGNSSGLAFWGSPPAGQESRLLHPASPRLGGRRGGPG